MTRGPVGANWYPDPLGRGEYRYWDGDRWTAWIATAGATRSDPFQESAQLPDPSFLTPTAAAVTPSPPPASYSAHRFRSLEGLTIAITWVAIAAIVSAIAAGIAYANRYDKIDTFGNRLDFESLADVSSADDVVDTTSAILVVVSLAVFVLVIIYFYRASLNTDLWSGERKTWATGWTIGAWFIPLGNLVLVPLVVAEIWRRSPEPGGGTEPGSAPSLGPVVVWWVLVVLGFVGAGFDVDPDTIDDYRVQDIVHVVGCIGLVAAGVLLITVVRSLTRRQTARQTPQQQPA